MALRTPPLIGLILGVFAGHLTLAGPQEDTLSSAPDTLRQPSAGEIKVTALLEQREVPLNRQAKVRVVIEWSGDIDRYEILEVENPALTNFELYGTATANRSEVVGGQVVTQRVYEFILKPKELGMGYVEGVVVRYRDSQTGREHQLVTNRLGIKVVDPIPEKEGRGLWWIGIPISLALIGGIGYWVFQRQRALRRAREEEKPKPILEELYLQHLQERIDLKSPAVIQGFSELSKLHRQYLAQKFGLQALEMTTAELVRSLEESGCEERIIRDTQDVLASCDVVKFSGGEASPVELERIYGKVEALLRDYLRIEKEKQLMAEQKGKK